MALLMGVLPEQIRQLRVCGSCSPGEGLHHGPAGDAQDAGDHGGHLEDCVLQELDPAGRDADGGGRTGIGGALARTARNPYIRQRDGTGRLHSKVSTIRGD
ncbi:hypothetical protein ACFYO0_45220 [Streptomyces sp. NPDC006365]|uniref:hypothetical protein n=1 Tax=Streptomyces sp. NPDC006365 TaxID=3364744 RepID=UPI00369493DC